MKRFIFSGIGVIALLLALTLNLRHSMNDYGLVENMYTKAFAEGTNVGDVDSTSDIDKKKKKYYELVKTDAVCTITQTSTTTRVTTNIMGSETVTEQVKMEVSGKYYKCQDTTDTSALKSCTEGCYI